MEILSVGEKIRKLRKDIGLKQEELTDDKITRSLISMIEHGKRPLSYQTATIIANKLNQYYQRTGKKITAEYLLESEKDQVRRIIEKTLTDVNIIISNKKNINCDYIYKIFSENIELAKKWSLKEEVSKILQLKGDLHYHITKYNYALIDYFSALEYYLETKDYSEIASLYIKIGGCYLKKLFLDEAVSYYHKAYIIAKENETPNLSKIKMLYIFNTIICHRKANKFDLSLQFINQFKNLNEQTEDLLDQVILMEANIYRDLGNHEKAEKIYKRLLRKETKLESYIKTMAYNDISVLYRKINNSEKVQLFINKVNSLINITPLNLPAVFWCELTENYKYLNQTEEAIKILEQGYDIAKEFLNYETLIIIALLISDIYIHHINNQAASEKYLKIAESLVLNNDIKSKQHDVYAKLAKFYCNLGEMLLCKRYLDKMINIGSL